MDKFDNDPVFKKLKEQLQRLGPKDMDAAQAIVGRMVERMNTLPVDDFDGLTPEQVDVMMSRPFEIPDLVRFHPDRITPGNTAVMRLFLGIADACGDKGMKATPSGYLPRKLMRTLAEDIAGEEAFYEPGKYWATREDEFSLLFMTRHCATFAGLIRKYRGRFMLTRKGRGLLEKEAFGEIFHGLFAAAASKWNWGCTDGFPELYAIQSAWLISLRWLQLFGAQPRDEYSFYARRFLKTFPAILRFIPKDSSTKDPEKMVRRAYGLRVFERFALAFGLAERDGWPRDMFHFHLAGDCLIRKTPLLDRFIEFRG
jgi:hypothetical protein